MLRHLADGPPQVFERVRRWLADGDARRVAIARTTWLRRLYSPQAPVALLASRLNGTLYERLAFVQRLSRRPAPATRHLGLEKVAVRIALLDPRAPQRAPAPIEFVITNRTGSSMEIRRRAPSHEPLEPRGHYERRVVQALQRRLAHRYAIVRMLTAGGPGSGGGTQARKLPIGYFEEFALDPACDEPRAKSAWGGDDPTTPRGGFGVAVQPLGLDEGPKAFCCLFCAACRAANAVVLLLQHCAVPRTEGNGMLRMLRRTGLALASVACVLLAAGTEAGADPIGAINGATQLNVTSFGTLNDLGVTVTPGGTAQVVIVDALPSPIVFYDVTSIDLDTSEIFHEGSLLELSTSATVSLANFIVDGGAGVVLADVDAPSGMFMDAEIFEVTLACSVATPCEGLDGTLTIEGLELSLTDLAGNLLATDLGIANLAGAPVAVANSSFTPIPEPGTALLGMFGLLLLGWKPRRT
ncbi:MAG: hypothetical protein QNK04_13055 [Myxococcota bacterium]|nr:hypothetical protein [Myxococcota bacterium]